jgi:hypothetical protein
MNEELVLASRFLAMNPEATIIAMPTCYIPAVVVEVEMVVQEIKPLPLLAEFVLRLILQGEVALERISKLLGLDGDDSIALCAADLVSSGALRYDPDAGFSLTSIGRKLALEHKEIIPTPHKSKFLFDRSIFKLSTVDFSRRVTTKTMRESSLATLPVGTKAAVNQASIPIRDVRRVMESAQVSRGQSNVIRVENVTRKNGNFGFNAKLIIYKLRHNPEPQAAVYIDGEFSEQHEALVASQGGVKALGITIEKIEHISDVPQELENQREDVSQIESIRLIETLVNPESDADSELATVPRLRNLKVFEHRPLMLAALAGAKERFFLKCPWISWRVVDREFLDLLEQCARRGVVTTIVHGYEDGEKSDAATVDRLERLAYRYPNLSILRHENTHGKVLIYDDVKVAGSFNWLNFRPDEDSTYYRDEDSDVITDKEFADQSYAAQMAEIKDHLLVGISKYVERNKSRPPATSGRKATSDSSNAKKASMGKSFDSRIADPNITPGFKVDEIVTGTVTNVFNFGVFVRLDDTPYEGLIHVNLTACNTTEELKEDFPAMTNLRVRIAEIEWSTVKGRWQFQLVPVFESSEP